MRYLKTYEENIINNAMAGPVMLDLERELSKWLNEIKPEHYVVERDYKYYRRDKPGLALIFKNSKYGLGSTRFVIFIIRVLDVSDNKQKDLKTKTKLKIELDYKYIRFSGNQVPSGYDEEFTTTLKEFISETILKYSYFKKSDLYNMFGYNMFGESHEIYIHRKDVENIVSDLDGFDIYLDSKKYNL